MRLYGYVLLVGWLTTLVPADVLGRRRSPDGSCPRRPDEALARGRSCLKQCDTDTDCKSKRKKCLCDGVCGRSCIKPDLQCDPLPNPINGHVVVTGNFFGSFATYKCDEGLRLVGPDHRICQADASWSGPEPNCTQATYCGQPPIVPNARHNGRPDVNQYELDTEIQYTCSLGYHTKGFASAKCYYYNGTTQWLGPDVHCIPVSCGDPGNVLNAHRMDEAFTFSSRVIYYCLDGFEIVGRNTRVCQGNGQWTGPAPYCRAVQCPPPEDPVNGRALYRNTSYGAEVTYECQYGHMLVGDEKRKCGPDRQWTGTKPYCKEIDCGSPGILYNGWLEGESTNLGSVVLFRCHEGMKLEGVATSTTCQLNGKWSHPLPKCMAPCVAPEIDHGRLLETTPGSKVLHGKRVRVECHDKYEITYNNTPTECHNSTWTNIPKCVPARCKSLPPRPRHGMVIAPKTDHGMKAKFKCKDGYKLKGDNVTECRFGHWTGLTPQCEQVYCPFPGYINHGKVLLVGNMGYYDYRPYVRKVTNNRQILFECNKGYTLAEGPPGATCVGGIWSPKQLPLCIPGQHPRIRMFRSIRAKREAASRRQARWEITLATSSPPKRRSRRNPAPCDPIPDAPFLHVNILKMGDGNESMPHGTEVEVKCGRGYGLNIGNKTAKCIKGKWRPRTPECVSLPCKVPRAHNGVFHHHDITVPENSEIAHNEVVIYSCQPGYQIHGSDSMRCWGGEWAIDDLPDCTPAPCELPHITNGQYGGGYRAGLTIAHGSTVEYECEAEYTKTTMRPIRCHLGELKPRVPACRHQSVHVVPVLDGIPHEADVHIKQPGSDISVIDFPASFRRSCGPPERVQNALVYRDGRLVTDNDHRFLDGTEVLFDCIAGITGEKTTWKIVCEDGTWVGRPHRCEGDPGSDHYEYLRNKSCVFRNTQPHLVTFYGDMRITDEIMEFPPGTELVSRCRDIGKYALLGSVRRRCVGGEWDGVKPTCFGLSQENDYALEKPPTILFRHQLGPIAQSNEGKLIVYPGTILHLECLWLRKYGTPHWEINHSYRKYPEGWTTDPGRLSELEYRLSIYHAQRDDSGTYTCVTPKGHRHSVDIIVRAVHCPRIPERPGLHVSNPSNKMNTKVIFSCKNGNALIGAEQATCLPSGNWSSPPPACENVECSDTIPINDRALRVNILSRDVGGTAAFSCAQGFGLRGPSEVICESSGQWSLPLPHCEEVRCPASEAPDNGYIQGSGVYKAGDVVQFNCNQGFMMEGQPIIVCQDNGRWSGPVPKCVQACTYPGTTIGGTVSKVKFYYSIGETVSFDCAQGLELKGARMLRCLPSGKWSNAIPQCIPGQG